MRGVAAIMAFYVFIPIGFLLAQTNDVPNPVIEIFYRPMCFDSGLVKDGKLCRLNGENYVQIYSGSQSPLSENWMDKIRNSPACVPTYEELMGVPLTGFRDGGFLVVITDGGRRHEYEIADGSGYIYDRTERTSRRCDILSDIYAYYAREKFRDFGLGEEAANRYYDLDGVPYPDGIPKE